jgi:D-glycero-alpha-D-manno-heptose-7-phosphate kinase
MIISRTPLRVSFAGGGTDLPSYYRAHGGGAVLSAAIDRYVYVLINQKFDDDIRLSYSRTAEYVQNVDDVKHPMAREAMKAVGVTKGIEIVTVSDIPAEGTGLGSSSSFAVGILNALHAYKGELRSPRDLAEEACRIEIDVLGEPIGKQDQYAAAFGGLRYYEFHPDGNVSINPLPLSRESMRNFASHFSLYYSGVTRSASNILAIQNKRTEENTVTDPLNRMKELAGETKEAILRGDYARVGHLLEEGWHLKKTLSEGISNPVLDQIYDKARAAGALGGKVTGAGGGGFFLVAAPTEKSEDVAKALAGLRRIKLNVSHEGSRIIFIER